MYRKLESAINQIMVGHDRTPRQEDLERVDSVVSIIEGFQVDISVLKAVDMVKLFKQIESRDGIEPQIANRLKELRTKWKHQCKTDNRKSTVNNLHGGNIIEVTDTTLSPPDLSPPDQWTILSKTHNYTQLFAIKYVVDRPIQNQDTRVCLVQGPPGTGKQVS